LDSGPGPALMMAAAYASQAQEELMDTKPFVVLVGMDFSEPADLALRQALQLASELDGAELHVATIVPQPATKGRHPSLEDRWIAAEGAVLDGVFLSLRSRVQAEVEAFPRRTERGEQRAPRRVVPHVRVDLPGLGMAQLAADIEADVILVGAHGQGKSRASLGSAAASTLELAHCPVVVVRSEKPR
jgi:nucleotide-binding universal stress UspA family protein